MRPRLLRALRNERGIAMVTVLFVGAALTVVAAAASFMAIRQLRATSADASGAQAVAYGEAGLQRFLNELKLGTYGLTTILQAGCQSPPIKLTPGVVGSGTYNAELTVFNPSTNPQVPPSPWSPSVTGPCAGRSSDPRAPQLYAISSTGSALQGRRVIRSVVTISGSSLPLGVFVNNINANGNPDFANISVFSSGDVFGREKMAFSGNDLTYFLGDVYPGQSMTTPIPAAVHAVGAIYATLNSKKGVEHPPNPNCNANPRGTTGQSLWDGSGTGGTVTSGCAGQVGFPPTSKFTMTDYNRITARTSLPQLTDAEYAGLKASAQATGIYCSLSAGGATSTCTKQGVPWTLPPVVNTADISGLKSFVAYFEYTGGDPLAQDIKWNATVGPCSDDQAINNNGIVVVRNGGATLRSAGSFYGNFIAPEGAVDAAGGYTIVGSVIARQLRLRGSATFKLDECAKRNPPSPLLRVTPGRWSEVDR